MSLGAVVVAAGKSERMGRPKALLPFKGTTFLGAILSTLARSRVDVVRIVLGHHADEIRDAFVLPDEVWAINEDYESGMLSSVCCGVRALPATIHSFLIWPVDHPLVSPATIARLIEKRGKTGKGIAIPSFDGRRGHPALFTSRMRDAILAAPPTIGLRAVAADRPEDLVEVPVEDRGVIADIDTPEDLDRWLGSDPNTSKSKGV